MRVTRYGVDVVLKFFLCGGIVILYVFVLVDSGIIRYGVVGVVGVLSIFVLNFFRDPDRTIPEGEGLVIAPADGKVVLIKEVYEGDFLRCDARQVSIFMSPLNVHVNRFPMAGTVGYFKHIQGKYLVAFDQKSSENNERTVIGIENGARRVLFKQIAGFIARRIVAPVALHQTAKAGERFGMIKFGSRADVIIPMTSSVLVKVNDRVTAGETILARF